MSKPEPITVNPMAAVFAHFADLQRQLAEAQVALSEMERYAAGRDIACREVFDIVTALEIERDRYKAQSERRREALVAVEWQPRNVGLEDSEVGKVARVVEYCPWCQVSRTVEHGSGCIIAAAIAAEEEER